ncbi:MAG: M23 family metallopeptidase [Desulfobulbaceae bacterium]|nr:M23 family metallopeptidase [Desulfobulbaceae bacterium]
MAQDKLHIIITGEQGNGRSFAVCKKTARRTIIAVLSISIILILGFLAGIAFFSQNLNLSSKNRVLDSRLVETMTALDEIQASRTNLIARYEDKIARLEEDRENLLESSISRLDEKSKVIEKVMDNIGVEVKIEEDPNHSGGPYISPDEQYCDQLILKADRYLEVLNKIPLGRPVPGKISSKFGNRTDPIKKRQAFHPGIDFRGNTGDEIKATADAVVKTAASNNVLGNHIILAHGNGYESIFAHLHKRLVKKGDKVKRGQVIGHIGNTGRSTGSHLHYGIRYNKKSIDPMKYLQVADLTLSLSK